MNIVDLKEEVREFKNMNKKQEEYLRDNCISKDVLFYDYEYYYQLVIDGDVDFKYSEFESKYQRKFKAKDQVKQRKLRNSLKWKG